MTNEFGFLGMFLLGVILGYLLKRALVKEDEISREERRKK